MSTPHTVFQERRALRLFRMLIVLLIAVVLVAVYRDASRAALSSATIQSTVVLDPTTAPMLTGMFKILNNGPGDQTDPDIDCDLAPYTNDDFFGALSIRYFDFATNTDLGIPGNGTSVLSDVNDGTIAFTEATVSGQMVVLFNTATNERTLVPGFKQSHPALGGSLVVFENRSFSTDPNESEISVYDRNTGNVTRLTEDALFDRNPEISRTGNAIVWEKCQTNGLGCEVYSAIQTAPGVFTTSMLTGAGGEDRHPRTNGEIVVYVSTRDGETDAYFQPVGGGSELRLSLPGAQRFPSIAGNLISFESPTQPNNQNYDVFVYDISTSKIYRVTDTPVNETLNNLTICNGTARIVYAAPAYDYDVFAFTFQPPSATENQLEDLIELVQSFNLPQGTENSLITKLEDAIAAVEAADTATACDLLSAFINECQAHSGKKLTTDQATQLINSANQIKTDLGC